MAESLRPSFPSLNKIGGALLCGCCKMLSMPAPRRLVLPPAGFPHWLPEGDPPGGLLYLAWGRRRFGQHPIESTLHDGWIYVAVRSGSPRILLGKTSRLLKAGEIALIGPDAVCGWSDRRGGTADMLVWVWRHPPEQGKDLDRRHVWSGRVTAESLELLTRLHALSRREIKLPDGLSARFLGLVQAQIDVIFLRAERGRQPDLATCESRLRLASEWMLRHLDLRDPLRGLADYMGVSSVTLQRWYRSSTGRTPRQAFLEVKLAEAKRRLATRGTSVKQVALELGYRHPGDFSRAYKKQFGHPPRTDNPPAK